jgi:integral membrane protein
MVKRAAALQNDDLAFSESPMDQAPVFLRNLRIMAAIEATTLVVLVFIAVPLKHLGGTPTAVQWVGPVHGIAFVMYMWMVITSAASGLWRRSEVVRLLVVAIVPFGGFLNTAWLARKQIAR